MTPIDNDPSAPQANQDASDEQNRPVGDIPTGTRPEVKIPPSHSCYQISCDKKRDGWDVAKMVAEFIGLGFLIIYTLYTAGIYRANKKAADATQKQLEMTDRPWLKDNVLSAFDMGWQHGSYLGWAVTIHTENVGNSVATGLFPEAKLIAIEGADFIDYPRREMKKVCDDVDMRFKRIENDPTAWATSIFRGEGRDFGGYNVYLLPSEVDQKSVDAGGNLGKSITPMLVGCVVYHYPSSEHAHHTGFVYMLSHTDDLTLPEPTRVFFGVGKNIPKDNVILKKVGQFVD